MDDLLVDWIDSLLNHIDEIENDLKGLTIKELENSNQLLRAVCFSLTQIGEQMNQLERKIGSIYKNLPWKAARKMRNVIVHDYYHTDLDQVYSTIINDLPALKRDFVKIKADILKNS